MCCDAMRCDVMCCDVCVPSEEVIVDSKVIMELVGVVLSRKITVGTFLKFKGRNLRVYWHGNQDSTARFIVGRSRS